MSEASEGMTRWIRSNEVYRAAVVLGLIDNYDWPAKRKIDGMIKTQMKLGKVLQDKRGPASSSPTFYRARLLPLPAEHGEIEGPQAA